MSRRLISAIVLCSFSANFAWAAESLPSKNLVDSYRSALIRSETVGSQLDLVDQAVENRRQAVGAILPNVSLVASYLLQEAPDASSAGFYPTTQPFAKLTATQPLFRGLSEIAALHQTGKLADAQGETFRQARVQLWDDVATAFYTILAYEKDLINLKTVIEYYDKRIKELRGRIKIGRSRESEVLTMESSKNSVEADIESTIGLIGTSRENFEFLTGLSRDTPLQDTLALQEKLPPVQKYTSTLRQRPDVKSANIRNDAADDGIAVARGAHYGSADLIGNYYLKRYGSTDTIHWDVQVALTFPIYAGGSISSKVRTAASQAHQAQLVESQTLRQADQEIRTFYINYQASLDQLKVLRIGREIARKNYETQVRDYRLGLVTNLDVLQALTSAEDAQRTLDRAIYTAKLNHLKLIASASQNHILQEPSPPLPEY